MITATIAGETFHLSWNPNRRCYLDQAGHPWTLQGDKFVSDRHGFTENWKPDHEPNELIEKTWKEVNLNHEQR